MASLKLGTSMQLNGRARCFTCGPAPRVLLLGASGLIRRPSVVQRADGDKASSSTPTEKASPSKEEDLPPWIRRERERELAAANPNKDPVPWPAYLLLSIIVAIAAVGSIFEWIDKNAIFGVVPVDSPLWAPILFFFAGTGLPLSGYCFYRGVTLFNEEAELQDKIDGYM